MKVVSPQIMREMDKAAIETFKIPGVVLMENAGREVALAVKNMSAKEKSRHLLIRKWYYFVEKAIMVVTVSWPPVPCQYGF